MPEKPNFDYYKLDTPMMRGEYLALVGEIYPDWKQLYTPVAAEADLKGFKWKGPGWYLNDLDSLLVLPSHAEGQYWFWVYSGRNPSEGFSQAVNSPVRVDERGEQSQLETLANREMSRAELLETLNRLSNSCRASEDPRRQATAVALLAIQAAMKSGQEIPLMHVASGFCESIIQQADAMKGKGK